MVNKKNVRNPEQCVRAGLAFLLTVVLAFQSMLVVIYEMPNKSGTVVLVEIALIVLGAICIALSVVVR